MLQIHKKLLKGSIVLSRLFMQSVLPVCLLPRLFLWNWGAISSVAMTAAMKENDIHLTTIQIKVM